MFNEVYWYDVQRDQESKLNKAITDFDGNRILNTPIEDLCTYFDECFKLDPPTLRLDRIEVDQKEKNIDVSHEHDRYWSTPGPHYVPGTEVTFTVPFIGDKGFFKIMPSTRSMSLPSAEVYETHLVLRFAGDRLNAKNVRERFDQIIGSIQSHLEYLRTDVRGHNDQIKAKARTQIEARKRKLLDAQNLVAELGFPLKQRSTQSHTYAAPSVKRKLKPTLPPQTASPYKPEPVLVSADYEHILEVLGNMADVMEKSPSAFKSMDEESLRSHFLVQLNGHYEGQATGETFNYSGKTDILLKVDGKNIFIAECKFWDGPKKLSETLDQLLAYSSWRDTKVALITFNRNKNFSAVLQSIEPTIQRHSNFKRTLQIPGESRFRFILSHKSDPSREMVVTVLAFDVPTE